MELRIEPTAELSLKFQNKKIGRLEALILDVSSGGGFLGVPKVKLAISINGPAFGDDKKTLNTLLEKLQKFKFLDILLKNY